MAEDYKKNISFYAGADYGLDPNKQTEYGNFFGNYRFPASSFSFPTDPRLANQLGAVSQKVNTGAKGVEVSGVTPGEFEAMPDQHLTEINRLKKLVGLDLTFHGPIVEATGYKRGSNMNEEDRKEAERQMWSAVQRSHRLDPTGNIIVTFHASNDLPEPETVVMNPKTGKEEITDFIVVDGRTGALQPLRSNISYFKSEDKDKYEGIEKQKELLMKNVEEHNKENWFRLLQNVSFHASNGESSLKQLNEHLQSLSKQGNGELTKEKIFSYYKDYLQKPEEINKFLESQGENSDMAKHYTRQIVHSDLYLRDAYQQLQGLFNQAYDSALKNNNVKEKEKDLKILDNFRNEIKPMIKQIEDPSNLNLFADKILQGVDVLRAIKTPSLTKPLKEYALDKASDTFSNLAFNSYKEFKDTAPIISIENPPAGMGLNRGSDLKLLVKQAQDKFIDKAQSELGMSKSEAKEQAEKLIGVTWDVGHINMIRKFGYDENDKNNIHQISAQTKEIAPYLKHIHLSDNFGMEHTELPMGMGNVPMQAHLSALKEGYKGQLDKIKKVVETGGPWFRDFKMTPFMQTLEAFGSPIYSMQMAPYWSQASHASGGYFSGYGNMLPQVHFSMYGSGFSNMPTELGGQLSGRSRVSGNPME